MKNLFSWRPNIPDKRSSFRTWSPGDWGVRVDHCSREEMRFHQLPGCLQSMVRWCLLDGNKNASFFFFFFGTRISAKIRPAGPLCWGLGKGTHRINICTYLAHHAGNSVFITCDCPKGTDLNSRHADPWLFDFRHKIGNGLINIRSTNLTPIPSVFRYARLGSKAEPCQLWPRRIPASPHGQESHCFNEESSKLPPFLQCVWNRRGLEGSRWVPVHVDLATFLWTRGMRGGSPTQGCPHILFGRTANEAHKILVTNDTNDTSRAWWLHLPLFWGVGKLWSDQQIRFYLFLCLLSKSWLFEIKTQLCISLNGWFLH